MKKIVIGLLSAAALLAPSISFGEGLEGSYVGLSGGMGIIKFDGVDTNGTVDDVSNSGLITGIVGYRGKLLRSGKLIFGLEADLGYYTSGSDWKFGAYGLMGTPVGDSGLAYLRTGYSKFNGDLVDLDGIVIGAGYEFAIGRSASLRLDYKYNFYGSVANTAGSVDYKGHEITSAFVINF